MMKVFWNWKIAIVSGLQSKVSGGVI